MQLKNNTILITGSTSGIGRALADRFHALGNKVIVAGRRQKELDDAIAANPGMKSVQLDVSDAASIKDAAAQIGRDYPQLNAIIHSAGIMRFEDLRKGEVNDAEAMVTTNLLGTIRVTAALLPLLLKQSEGMIMTVSSGLAFVPLAPSPTYCATKAAIHSYTESLRYQLRDTAIRVLELAPPYVQTELGGSNQASDPDAMPLKDFIDETVSILQNSPDAEEILVQRVVPMRFAEKNGQYDQFFKKFNDEASEKYKR